MALSLYYTQGLVANLNIDPKVLGSFLLVSKSHLGFLGQFCPLRLPARIHGQYMALSLYYAQGLVADLNIDPRVLGQFLLVSKSHLGFWGQLCPVCPPTHIHGQHMALSLNCTKGLVANLNIDPKVLGIFLLVSNSHLGFWGQFF